MSNKTGVQSIVMFFGLYINTMTYLFRSGIAAAHRNVAGFASAQAQMRPMMNRIRIFRPRRVALLAAGALFLAACATGEPGSRDDLDRYERTIQDQLGGG